jgi:hypothetical protein
MVDFLFVTQFGRIAELDALYVRPKGEGHGWPESKRKSPKKRHPTKQPLPTGKPSGFARATHEFNIFSRPPARTLNSGMQHLKVFENDRGYRQAMNQLNH